MFSDGGSYMGKHCVHAEIPTFEKIEGENPVKSLSALLSLSSVIVVL